ncbi:MAG TPA: hypothetical protein VKU02_19245 [Gemmataceae bacterium]|nr:hypothetical protein [Gemmataceae bacterium]
MMQANLTRDQLRRRIQDNLRWGRLAHHVIEPLPPLVVPPPPNIPVSEPAKPLLQPHRPVKQLAKRLITTIPFLGRAAIILLLPMLVPLRAAGALGSRLQNIAQRIDHLLR